MKTQKIFDVVPVLKLPIYLLLIVSTFIGAACKKTQNANFKDTLYLRCNASSEKTIGDAEIHLSFTEDSLFVSHTNALVNCAFQYINITTSIHDNMIEIEENPVPIDGANCLCPVDIFYGVGPIESGYYLISIKLGSQEIYNQHHQI
ncbi:MAG: hypothetical protein LBV46_03570 [Bacteroidales bacterium]|jgi:hypothetical protein|nr:hypothetical protein [Bacteroidales bacterium]